MVKYPERQGGSGIRLYQTKENSTFKNSERILRNIIVIVMVVYNKTWLT